jgi:hypothetical protein
MVGTYNILHYKLSIKSHALIMEYRELLTKIEDVRRVLGVCSEINLPQIVVIGGNNGEEICDDAVALFGIPFPENDGTTTKCPIVVHTRNSDDV